MTIPVQPDDEQRHRLSLLAVNLGLAMNILLAFVKVLFGIVGHSSALLADGVNSASDVAYFLIVRIFIKLARQPADEEHPYGHRQMETIAALVVGAFVLTTAVAIFWDSINGVYDIWLGQDAGRTASVWALMIALATIGVKIVLTLITRRIGARLRNPAILALAFDHRNDIVAASAAAIGILFGRLGYPWMDPLAGAVVAVVILHTGIQILRESSSNLMDAVPSRQLHEQVNRILADVPGVLGVEETLAHRFGPYLVLNLTILVDGVLTVAEGDRIASEVESRLQDEIDLLRRVHVHYHPAQR